MLHIAEVIYFGLERSVVRRGGAWMMVDNGRLSLEPCEQARTLPDSIPDTWMCPLTGPIESEVSALTAIISEAGAAGSQTAKAP
jgi:sulfate adenylyltransferase subunit 2